MLTFMAGAITTGAEVARYNVVRKSSAMPRANLAMMFGCGLRRLLFAPNTGASPPAPGLEGVVTGDALGASVQLLVRQALSRWLAGIIDVAQVTAAPGSEQGVLEVEVRYRLIETQQSRLLQVKVR